jgi:hypothetical protein
MGTVATPLQLWNAQLGVTKVNELQPKVLVRGRISGKRQVAEGAR